MTQSMNHVGYTYKYIHNKSTLYLYTYGYICKLYDKRDLTISYKNIAFCNIFLRHFETKY